MGVRIFVAALAAVLAGCSQTPPPYESSYTPTTETVPDAPPTPQASFVDTFDRPNTDQGNLGDGWDLRTYIDSLPLTPATDGFIRNNAYTYAGDSVVYAVRHFDRPVTRMGAAGKWRQVGDGPETTLAMAITPNDQIITDMVHFTANRGRWDLTLRRGGGDFVPVAGGDFTPTLAPGGEYRFEIEATDTSVTVRVPGSEVTTPADLTGLSGDRAFWEEYTKPTPAGNVFDFDTVWADY